jgi:transposase
MTMGTNSFPPRSKRREVARMETPEDVAAMLRLHAAGWGTKRIAEELGCARNTVRRYLRQGGWQPYAGGARGKQLDDHLPWLERTFDQHHGNAEVVRQELVREKGVEVSLRTVERAVRERRRTHRVEAVATVRFETAPGRQLQADFGELWVTIGGVRQRVHVCVLTLGYSRRLYVRAYPRQQQVNWLATMEAAFHHFGGVPEEVLVDNARALVARHDVETGEIAFADRFAQFAAYWGFRPRACAPYRARTKGKDESGVRYVKRNALAGRAFDSWAALDAWLDQWMREVADVRVHGTTGDRPIDRFTRLEGSKLRSLRDRPPFLRERELVRRVHNDACVEVDANWYSVPWRLVGTTVTVRVRDDALRILHGGRMIAEHARVAGRRQRVVDAAHWDGLTPSPREPEATEVGPPPAEFERPLSVYAALIDEVAA